MRRTASLLLVAALLLTIVPAASAGPVDTPADLVRAPAGSTIVPGSYLVVLDSAQPAAVSQEHAREHGAEVERIYRYALQGYAARMTDRAAAAIARDPRVVRVEPETVESIQQQTLPTGIDRIDADRNPTITTTGGTEGVSVDVPVAIIDTGIAAHQDLNVAGRVDCTVSSGGFFNRTYSCVEGGTDSNGHGTHVAGTVAAKDDGVGVVGVAPGAPLWAVKVCPTGSCPAGAIIAGIDWVAGKKVGSITPKVDFAAANFSISSADADNTCSKPANATHQAICGLVDKGVVFVMAAGNDGREKTPYPIALSVSAIADFDGKPGAQGSPTCRTDEDDTLANFSNYGSKVRIAAPGVCILSSWNDGTYNTISGTSMATPHVTGAVALYLHATGTSPATTATGARGIEDAITGAALPQGTTTSACSYDDAKVGGPLLFVNATAFGGEGTCDAGTGGGDDPGNGGGNGGDDPAAVTLSVTGYKVRGLIKADLTWSGATTSSVDITRNDAPLATVPNTGTYTDNIDQRGGGSYTYRVCEVGTSVCSAPVTVTF
jgi:subtilisin